MQTNHLSHFLLALGLLPALKRGAEQPPQQHNSSNAPAGPEAAFRPRIVSVASAMHYFGYKFGPEDPLQKKSYSTTLAYGNSKMGQASAISAGMCMVLLHPTTLALEKPNHMHMHSQELVHSCTIQAAGLAVLPYISQRLCQWP